MREREKERKRERVREREREKERESERERERERERESGAEQSRAETASERAREGGRARERHQPAVWSGVGRYSSQASTQVVQLGLISRTGEKAHKHNLNGDTMHFSKKGRATTATP